MTTKPDLNRETDPICGMLVDPSAAAGRSERDGKTYHFSSTACKERFDSTGRPEPHLCCRSAS